MQLKPDPLALSTKACKSITLWITLMYSRSAFTTTIFIRYLAMSNQLKTNNLTILPIGYWSDANLATLLFALLGCFVESAPYCFYRQSDEKSVAAMFSLCELYIESVGTCMILLLLFRAATFILCHLLVPVLYLCACQLSKLPLPVSLHDSPFFPSLLNTNMQRVLSFLFQPRLQAFSFPGFNVFITIGPGLRQ